MIYIRDMYIDYTNAVYNYSISYAKLKKYFNGTCSDEVASELGNMRFTIVNTETNELLNYICLDDMADFYLNVFGIYKVDEYNVLFFCD